MTDDELINLYEEFKDYQILLVEGIQENILDTKNVVIKRALTLQDLLRLVKLCEIVEDENIIHERQEDINSV